MSTAGDIHTDSTNSRPSPAPSAAGSTGTSGITVRTGPNGQMSFRRCVSIPIDYRVEENTALARQGGFWRWPGGRGVVEAFSPAGLRCPKDGRNAVGEPGKFNRDLNVNLKMLTGLLSNLDNVRRALVRYVSLFVCPEEDATPRKSLGTSAHPCSCDRLLTVACV